MGMAEDPMGCFGGFDQVVKFGGKCCVEVAVAVSFGIVHKCGTVVGNDNGLLGGGCCYLGLEEAKGIGVECVIVVDVYFSAV